MNRTKLAKNDRKELNAIFQLATESKAAKEATNRVTQILRHYMDNGHGQWTWTMENSRNLVMT